jgi:DNA-directed RNA polymerase subunit H (RpoH/RPB5)
MSLKPSQILDYLYDSRKIIIDMLNYRGFNIDNYSSYTKDELNTLFEKTNSKISVSDVVGPLDILVEKKNENNETEQLFIKYRLDKFKKTKSQEQQILDIYTNIIKKEDTLLLIYLDDIKFKPTKKESNVELFIDDIYITYGYFIQLFGIRNLLFNVMDHYTVPEHVIINKKEQEELFIKFNIKENSNYPTIRREDPVAKMIGLKPGEICKIKKPTSSNIYSYTYRLCTM